MTDRRPYYTADDALFTRRVFIVVTIGILLATLWALIDILLLIFGSGLVAILLRSAAVPIAARVHVSQPIALTVVVLMVVTIVAAGAYFFGSEILQQVRNLIEKMPAMIARITASMPVDSVVDLVKNSGAASGLGSIFSRFVQWSTSLFGALASAALVVVGGIYMAVDPDLYRNGFLKLFPPSINKNVEATLDDAAEALRRWVGGQLVAMVLVGSLTGAGLWLVGVPNAFALGLIMGLADFVPYVGPIFAAIPILLSAGAQDLQTLWWALAVVLIVQQVESNLIMPVVAGALNLTPVVGLFSVVAMGVVFGPLGLLLGFPLAIVFDVAIRRLYVLDSLGEPVEILGEPALKSETL